MQLDPKRQLRVRTEVEACTPSFTLLYFKKRIPHEGTKNTKHGRKERAVTGKKGLGSVAEWEHDRATAKRALDFPHGAPPRSASGKAV